MTPVDDQIKRRKAATVKRTVLLSRIRRPFYKVRHVVMES